MDSSVNCQQTRSSVLFKVTAIMICEKLNSVSNVLNNLVMFVADSGSQMRVLIKRQ